ncbi:hypothetical protein [Haliscomenobacter hydrossis]|uniref:Peptidase S74 domain-containing protein n=1 Tax=Haliscomenobacter hydrossis (strain ATCC 27775 / DSM 1100 / LMG 10767 / O) TaxID=760192 RepID=F4KTP6_HALH1|nr:hypothetical protein [Haliscomenobacter hydrossis]AEE53420.1 hypothetical protein Halhy_5596 [Haliscomenobacter hydrossis DSM 1100]
MKKTSFIPVFCLIIALFVAATTAQAQWINGTSIYPTDLNKKVGIGLKDPNLQLEVKGGFGLRANDNTVLANFSDDGKGNLNINSYYSTFIGSVPKHILLNPAPFYGRSGNVGVGATDPTEAKLVVKGSIGNTVAMFGQGQAGISLVRDWASIGFNAYYNGTWKAMSKGRGAVIGCDPTTGRIEFIQNGLSNANEAVSTTTPMVIEADGKVSIGGRLSSAQLTVVSNQNTTMDNTLTLSNPAIGPNQSHVHWGARGDWYIRSAADNGVVVIQDNAGAVGIGTGNTAGFKLAVNGKIRAKEIRVETGWADYVFAPEYKLRPLEEVESFIKANQHLPEIQPASEIQANGLDVAATTTKMMAKIEELTLYLIEMKKENDALKQRVNTLENKQ